MKTTAYCYRSGEIDFCSGHLPDGVLPIRFNATKAEVKKIKVMARLAYDNKTLLIPGVPEAEDENTAYEAFNKFVRALGFPARKKGTA